MILSVEEVLQITGGKLLQGEGDTLVQGISTDSRTLSEGELFIALSGLHFDGHHYALEALNKRAGGVLIDEEKTGDIRWNGHRAKAVITVKDTLSALGELGRAWRRKQGIPVVALTGSNGKTTTKEMIAACLETAFPILKTKENLNNLIGVPLTLLTLTPKERVAVIEMGMNVPGEIRRLTEITEPDIGLITNIQSVHLEGMGSLERLQEEKGELFRRMRRDGTILVNQDDPRIVDLAKDYPGQKITYGINHPADIMAKEIRQTEGGLSFTLILEGEVLELHLQLVGKHFVPDALSAVAVASLFGLETDQVKETLEKFRPFPMRMEALRLDGGKTLIINDAYNANPSSMQVALETLAEIKGEGRSIAVLGDMLELGPFTKEAHEQIGQRASALSIDFLFVLGEEAPVVIESAVRHGFPMERARAVESHSEAVALLRQLIQRGDRILVKGSRKMKMEEIVKSLSEGRT